MPQDVTGFAAQAGGYTWIISTNDPETICRNGESDVALGLESPRLQQIQRNVLVVFVSQDPFSESVGIEVLIGREAK